jgi:hypothetical protein
VRCVSFSEAEAPDGESDDGVLHDDIVIAALMKIAMQTERIISFEDWAGTLKRAGMEVRGIFIIVNEEIFFDFGLNVLLSSRFNWMPRNLKRWSEAVFPTSLPL